MTYYEWHTPYSAALAARVQEYLSCLRCHDWDHTVRVLRNAWELMRREKCDSVDLGVVELAVLLHDVARPKEMKEGRHKLCHAQEGARMAPEFLRACGVPEELYPSIVQCIRTHRFRSNDRPESLVARIVFDADKLDALGAVGVARAFYYAGHIGSRLHNTREEALHAEDHTENDTAFREYLVKLSKVPAQMLTESGRCMAYERLETTMRFFEALNRETDDGITFLFSDDAQA